MLNFKQVSWSQENKILYEVDFEIKYNSLKVKGEFFVVTWKVKFTAWTVQKLIDRNQNTKQNCFILGQDVITKDPSPLPPPPSPLAWQIKSNFMSSISINESEGTSTRKFKKVNLLPMICLWVIFSFVTLHKTYFFISSIQWHWGKKIVP